MERPAITALTAQLRRHVDLSKSRLETMALLTVGMIGARTVNLVHIADERGSTTVDPASTYRRLQRFFQHVRLEEDWSAPLLAGFAGGAEKRTLIIDRTNWKVGETHINLFVLAIRTRHSQVPLMWTVLDKAGTSDMEERIALIQRYIACFGKPGHNPLTTCRKRWAIDFGSGKRSPDRFLILPHVRQHQNPRPDLRGYQADVPGQTGVRDRHRRPGRRLVGPGRKNRPGPKRPAAKGPRLPRQILFSNRLHTPAKPAARQ